MLAKYIPGGVWTPTARVVALRRFGVRDTPVVLASILLEAGLSALAGVGVFLVGLGSSAAPTRRCCRSEPSPCSSASCSTARVRGRRAQAAAAVRRERGRAAAGADRVRLLGFYALTWPLRGAALFFLLRALGGDPSVSEIPYLGGVSAVGAIVAVLAIFAPSGLGVREASMYGLLLAVTTEAIALGATVNRLAITLVEALLLLVGVILIRRGRSSEHAVVGAPTTESAG